MPNFFRRLMVTFLPSTCYVCDGISEGAVCKSCIEDFLREYRNEKRLFIRNPEIVIQAPFTYKGLVKEMIEDIKYRGIFFSIPFFADHLTAMIKEYSYDYLIPVPLHYLRRWRRGFNQSEEIAKQISKSIGTPIFKGVVRVRNTKSQTKLSRKERIINVKGAFRVKSKDIEGKKVAIIDDVITTGATTVEIARLLYNRGALKVDIYTVSMAEFD